MVIANNQQPMLTINLTVQEIILKWISDYKQHQLNFTATSKGNNIN